MDIHFFYCDYNFYFIGSRYFIILAGTPPTMQLSGTSLETTAFAATNTLLPIDILPKAFAPGPNAVWSPIVQRAS